MSGGRNGVSFGALSRPRFELITMEGAIERTTYLPEDAKVAVTCSPTQGIEATLQFSEELLGNGFEAVPYLAARLVADGAHLEEIAHRLEGLNIERFSSSVATRESPPYRIRAR